MNTILDLIRSVAEIARMSAGERLKQERNKTLLYAKPITYDIAEEVGEDRLEELAAQVGVEPEQSVPYLKRRFEELLNEETARIWKEIEQLQYRSSLAQNSNGKLITICNAELLYVVGAEEEGVVEKLGTIRVPMHVYMELYPNLYRGVVFGLTDVEDIDPSDFVGGKIEHQLKEHVIEVINENVYWSLRSRTGHQSDIKKIKDSEEIKYGKANNIRMDLDMMADGHVAEVEATNTDYMGNYNTRSAVERSYWYNKIKAEILNAKTSKQLNYAVAGRLFQSFAARRTPGYTPVAVDINSKGKKHWTMNVNMLSKAQREELYALYDARRKEFGEIMKEGKEQLAEIYTQLKNAADNPTISMMEMLQGLVKTTEMFWALFNQYARDKDCDSDVRACLRAYAARLYREKDEKAAAKAPKSPIMTLDEAQQYIKNNMDNVEGLMGDAAAKMIGAAQIVYYNTKVLPLTKPQYAGLAQRKSQ